MTAASGSRPSSSRRARRSRPARGRPRTSPARVRVDQQFQATAPGRVLRRPRDVRAGSAHGLAQPPARPDARRHERRGPGPAWGDPVDEIRPGDLVWIPAGQKHWHGASPTTAMTHIAIVETARRQELRLDGEGHRRAVRRPRPPAAGRRGGPGRASRRPADTGAAAHGRLRPQAGAAHRRRALRRRVGAPAALPARPQPRDDQRARRHEPARPAPLAPRPRPAERRDRGGDRRDDHAPGLLRGLAERGHGGDGGEGRLREEAREAVGAAKVGA